ncbi:MAG: helix-turn-helix transcriptional regulator [Nitrospirota bacterium]
MRLDSGLFQRQAAEIIGVCEQTLFYWEQGREPELRHMPAVIKFLGYVPFECPNDPIGKLRYFKRVNGLSYKRLGKLMGRDPEQLTDWLSGRHKPCRKNIQYISNFLHDNIQMSGDNKI